MSPSLAARQLATRRSAQQLRMVLGRRFESTATSKATEAASKATEAAKDTASKAAQGLSRVTSAAGPAIMGAAKGLGNTLSNVGGRTGKLINFVQRQTPFVVYYARVGAELAKIVFQRQAMSPPSVATFQTYFQNVWKQIQRPGALLQSISSKTPNSTQSAVQQLRNVSNAQLAAGGVLLAEILGFFTVGEMIGRFKLIGYHGDAHAGAHH